jgi:DNA-binding transcriptional ArsR family regulator
MVQGTNVNDVMRALADPTRRGVFERLVGAGEISVVELTRGGSVTQGAVSQHLKSLKSVGLVGERPEGRNVYYSAQPEGLASLVEWLGRYGAFWIDRIDTLERLLRDEDARKSPARRRPARKRAVE